MFTGIIKATTELVKREGDRYFFALPRKTGEELEIGGSIAVNGACLTITEFSADRTNFGVDVSEETRSRTTLGKLRSGDPVNLEYPLEATGLAGRLDGHIVQGHVDATGRIRNIARKGKDYLFRLSFPAEFSPYLVEKGAVAIDGISLTPYQVKGSSFAVTVIPHTYSSTTLKQKRAGSEVNLEFDVLAKYVERAVAKGLG